MFMITQAVMFMITQEIMFKIGMLVNQSKTT